MKKILVVAIIAIVLIGTIALLSTRQKVISPQEMMVVQTQFIGEIQELMADMAHSYSLYFAGETSDQEFLNDVESFRFRYKSIMNRSNAFFKKYKVDDSMPIPFFDLAMFCLEEVKASVGDILEMTVQDGKILPCGMLYDYYKLQYEKINNNLQNFKAIVEL